MNAFNTSPVAVDRYQKCAICSFPVDMERCNTRERSEATPIIKTDMTFVLYPNGDAVSAECVGCNSIGTCDDTSPFDGRYKIMVKNGKVYAKIKSGRDGEVVIISAKINRLIKPNIIVTRNVLITGRTQ